MITTQQLIERLTAAGVLANVDYAHPILTLNLLDDGFGDDYESNIEIIASRAKIDMSDVIGAASRPLLALRFHTEQIDVPEARSHIAEHWLALAQGQPIASGNKNCKEIGDVRAVHFYGYKGGQARSTTLALAAKRLADTGYRVLVIDADIEAPSLHLLFGSAIPRLSGSLMGVTEPHSEIRPVAAYSGRDGGRVDLIGTRPSGDEYDIDFLAFALATSLDPGMLRRGFEKLRTHVAAEAAWDVVLIDHRTGVSPSVVPVIGAWPGSAIMTLRPDLLSTPATKVAAALFSAYPQNPGAFINFSLDPEERRDQFSSAAARVKEVFLGILARAVALAADSSWDDDIDPIDLEQNYINWYFDRAFLDEQTPDFDRLSKDNQESINDLIQILGLSRASAIASDVAEAKYPNEAPRAPSGATDAGWFIETNDISTLMQESSSYSYIFGRKGTGKTRIYREMHSRERGVPLLAAADYGFDAVRAQSFEAQSILNAAKNDFESFWWKLIASTLSGRKDVESDEVGMALVYSISRTRSKPITLLIDGVETAVSSRDTKRFVESLFRVLSTIQNDSTVNEIIQFKLFIRPDLSVGIQNIEQQTAGRKFDLRWEESAIFNYMLSEIARKPWFKTQFVDICDEIASKHTEIVKGRLERAEYERLLLGIFPQKIRRNNLLTMTFLRTYFSDAVSETTDKKSSFYPRVVGAFLEHVERKCKQNPAAALDSAGRVSHTLIVDSFTEATDEFISEIKQELYFALDLNNDVDVNRSLVDELMSALSGLQTPFSLDECVDKLFLKVGKGTPERVLREALRQMKDMGIFEAHPVDPSKWRAGRLFKEALKMKYVR